jgi:hypothetical protein
MAADDEEAKGGAGARQRPAVTIDLTAQSVRAGPAGAAPEPPKAEAAKEPPASGRRSGDAGRFSGAARAMSGDEDWRRAASAGIVGGLVALAVILLLQAVGLLPAPGRSAANQAIDQAKAAGDAITALDRRLTAVEAMTEGIPAMRSEAKALADKVASLDAIRNMTASRGDLDAVAANLAAVAKKIDGAAPAATRGDLAALAERVNRVEVAAAAGGGDAGAANAAVSSLTGQLADAEGQVRALTDRVAAAEAKMGSLGAPSGGAAATRTLAVATLRRAAEGDAPFAADVDMVASLGLAGDDIAALRPMADKGVASRAAIAGEFPAVGEAILAAAATTDPNAGFLRRLLDSLVTIRPTGPIAGRDPAAIVSRMRDDTAKGDLAAALSEREALPEAGKAASAEWAAKAADRVALDALIEKIARAFDPPKAG